MHFILFYLILSYFINKLFNLISYKLKNNYLKIEVNNKLIKNSIISFFVLRGV